MHYVGKSKSIVDESVDEQQNVLDHILPDKIDIGRNPSTFIWMLTRISDGLKQPTPRELIHLFDESRRIQIDRLERGEQAPQGTLLFERSVFKAALKVVSSVRYEQTFRAENPKVSKWTDALRGKKAEQTLDSLVTLWEVDRTEAKSRAEQLTSLGFFEKRSSQDRPSYWVPFIYRDALDLVQGKADI